MQSPPFQARVAQTIFPSRIRLHAAALVLALLPAAAAFGQAMYQWRDEKGRLHMSDKPPAGAASATRVTPRPPNIVDPAVSPGAAAASLAGGQDGPATPASAAASGARAGKTAPRPGETECQRRQREYQDSMACFAPLRNAAGAISPEAAEKCGPTLPEPPPC